MKVISLTYHSTNIYLIQCSIGYIMFDAGWPDTFPELLHLLKQKDIHTDKIKYLIISHFHPDHGGLAQDIKDCGAKLVLHKCQVPFMDEFKKYFKPQHNFKNIGTVNNIIVTSEDSRVFLKGTGIEGEIIQTPGHSDDSISLIIDDCCAFTGDLSNITASSDDDSEISKSWMKIRSCSVKSIYPGHGNSFEIESR
jgi:glyoxylase-like metal-dependent hydrolase (beta-lactamase superfamily II)